MDVLFPQSLDFICRLGEEQPIAVAVGVSFGVVPKFINKANHGSFPIRQRG